MDTALISLILKTSLINLNSYKMSNFLTLISISSVKVTEFETKKMNFFFTFILEVSLAMSILGNGPDININALYDEYENEGKSLKS